MPCCGQVCGAMTSGGSESIVSAMFATFAFQAEQRGITAPEVIMADTAHAAYRKGASYSGAKYVPDCRVDSSLLSQPAETSE